MKSIFSIKKNRIFASMMRELLYPYQHPCVSRFLRQEKSCASGSTLSLIEKSIYGSSRLGVVNQKVTFLARNDQPFAKDTFSVRLKDYELTDHLGNVMTTFADFKQGNQVDRTSVTDYYPFGYPIPNRTKYPEKHRFGFNGQEADNEIFGDKQSYTAEFWQYDTRIARRWNIDPVQHPWESPYSVFGGDPLNVIDPDGNKIVAANIQSQKFMKSYFREQFGSSKMFKFSENGTLEIRNKQFNKAMKNGNVEQQALLTGMQEAIEIDKTVKVMITENSNKYQFTEPIPNTYLLKTSTGDLGASAGITWKSPNISFSMILINNTTANNEIYDAGSFKLLNNEIINFITHGSGSDTFFHEVLDEFLNFHEKKTVTKDSPKSDKVDYQNKALINRGQPSRTGRDHQE